MIRRLWNAIRAPFAWRYFDEAGVWAYYENAVTGKRGAVRISNCYGPQHGQWLDGGPWEYVPLPPGSPPLPPAHED